MNLASCIQNNGGDDDEIPEENTKQYRTDVLTDVSPVILDELELGFKSSGKPQTPIRPPAAMV